MKARDWKGKLSRLAWAGCEASVMSDPMAYCAYLEAVSRQEVETTAKASSAGAVVRSADRADRLRTQAPRVMAITAGSRP